MRVVLRLSSVGVPRKYQGSADVHRWAVVTSGCSAGLQTRRRASARRTCSALRAGSADPSGSGDPRSGRIFSEGLDRPAALIVQTSTYMPRGRYQKSDISRERILEAATEVFATRGYAGAGRRPAGRALRASPRPPSTTTSATRKACWRRCSSAPRRSGSTRIQSAAQQGGDPLQRLDRALAGMRAMLEERPWIYKLFQILALEVADEKPEIRATLRAILDKARDAIVDGMRDALGVDGTGRRAGRRHDARRFSTASRSACRSMTEISLDEVFAELRRLVAFMVASRLNPELAQLFDHPPESLRLMVTAARDERSASDERSGQSDR